MSELLIFRQQDKLEQAKRMFIFLHESSDSEWIWYFDYLLHLKSLQINVFHNRRFKMEFTELVKCRLIMWVFVDKYPVYVFITCQSFFSAI